MNKATKIVLTLTAMLAAGCNEGTVAPNTESPSDASWLGGSTADLSGTDTARFSFVLDPHRSMTYSLGKGNSITFPAGSLCDPTKSTYGMGTWDQPCVRATTPVTIDTKAWLDRHGYVHMDFSQSVRFVPTDNPAGWVMLSLSNYGASVNPWTVINYCTNTHAAHCIDESKSDPTLATIKNPVTGELTRRVKHFSGYSITAGDGCDPTVDPSCDPNAGGGFARIDTATVSLARP